MRNLVAGSLLLASSLTFAQGLQISLARQGKTLLCVPVDKSFSLSFIHSVSLTPVTDVYEIREHNQIIQIREDFITHGQGLPSLQNEPDAKQFEISKHGYRLHLERKITKLIVQTDKRFKNRLHTSKNGQTIETNLNQWADTGLYLQAVSECL